MEEEEEEGRRGRWSGANRQKMERRRQVRAYSMGKGSGEKVGNWKGRREEEDEGMEEKHRGGAPRPSSHGKPRSRRRGSGLRYNTQVDTGTHAQTEGGTL